MEFVTNEKLTIVGAAGMIGSNMAQTAIMMGLTPNICLYDPYAPGLEGVAEELEKSGFAKESIEKYQSLFAGVEKAEDGVQYLADTLGEYLDADVMTNFKDIITAVEATKGDFFKLVFDPTLVRGMSYYTGTIFEIAMPEFGGSCGGGGRYD